MLWLLMELTIKNALLQRITFELASSKVVHQGVLGFLLFGAEQPGLDGVLFYSSSTEALTVKNGQSGCGG